MALNDIYEIVDHATYLGQQVVGVYHVLQVENYTFDDDPIELRLALQFQAAILPALTACQLPQMVHNKISVRNLFDANESRDYLINMAGTRTNITNADPYAKWVCWSMTFQGTRASIRAGAKRIAGFAEQQVTSGFIVDPVLVGYQAAYGNALLGGLDPDGNPAPRAFRFGTVKRIAETTPKGVRWRLPETVAESEFSLWNSFLVNLEVTSQDTRKSKR